MTTMTPEERFERIERQLEFLAVNQAQLTASVQSHNSQIAENSRQIGQLADLTMRIGRIVEEQARHMDEGFTRMDERLSTLIDVVERYFSNGHEQ